MLHFPPNKKIILFDGECNLCDSAVQFVIQHDKKDIFLSSINDKNIYLLQQDSVSIVKKHYKRQEYSHSLIHLLVDWHIGSS